MKICNYCGKEFEPSHTTPYQKYCSVKCRQRGHRQEHKESRSAYGKKYRLEHSEEIRLYMRGYLREYAKKNKDRVRKIKKKSYDKHREKRVYNQRIKRRDDYVKNKELFLSGGWKTAEIKREYVDLWLMTKKEHDNLGKSGGQ